MATATMAIQAASARPKLPRCRTMSVNKTGVYHWERQQGARGLTMHIVLQQLCELIGRGAFGAVYRSVRLLELFPKRYARTPAERADR